MVNCTVLVWNKIFYILKIPVFSLSLLESLEEVKNELRTHTLSDDFGQIKEFFKEHKINNGSVCSLCEQVAATIIAYRHNGASRNKMISLFKYVCSNIEELDAKVCTGFVNINIVSTAV